MAFYRTGGGGSATETVLWTNGSPTSSFAAQTVTLSQSMENFKYLKFKAYGSVNNYLEINIIVAVDEFKHSLKSGTVVGFGICGANSGTSANRKVWYSSDTKVEFSSATAGSNTYNNASIPLEIIGIKEA